MAAYTTTPDAVLATIDTDLPANQVQQFINDADLWVSEEMLNAGLSDARLEMIERYLTCGLIRLRDMGVSLVRYGVRALQEKYQVDPQVSDYLIRAAALDSSNTVRRAFLAPRNQQAAEFHVGKGYIDETPASAPWWW